MSADKHRFNDDVAIITGAGGGIGGAVARRLAEEGASVVACDIDAGRADAIAAEIERAGGSALAVAADLSDSDSVGKLFDATLERYGPVSILINNAGLIGQTRHFLEADDNWWHRLISNNLSSVYYCSRAAAAIMAEAGRGVIISSSSGGATRAHRGEAAYDAAKGGIEALTRAMALDLAPYGIRVCAVAPGSINVAPPGVVSDEVLAQRGASIPLGRVGTPDDLAATYAFLASREADYITGVVVPVDGGMIVQQRSPQVDIFGLDKYPRLGALGPAA
jgi:NAD(P)-dependent dehydrogenase (short-subunit alcohol dehydrogenase family)